MPVCRRSQDRRGLRASALVACLLALLACAKQGPAPRTVVVFAAASLAAPFAELAADFERLHPDRRVVVHTAGTPQLVVQVREGAKVDVFASADELHMQRVLELRTADGVAPPAEFARNRLAIVVAAGNPRGIGSLVDLARPELRVVLCGPEVPAGRYARRALEAAGVVVRSVSDEPSVKAVVAKVQLGEVDAGVVYATDVRGAAGVEGVGIAAAQNVVASYPIVALGPAGQRGDAEAFVGHVLGNVGRQVFERHGFEVP
jgi:molybdate transport system substrate-binding protein